ncbi:hypothetical protein BS47DRAFT_1342903 [Hydnum rufescens UP504]|uniref:Uncharacterized protein n=1 Tax=Hydnum rufescens UP504 TaxID=1448309 RepID=A0A9P6DY61_9AGAM|nr:hypothetical protein BS47DRAFT_1342903 [Hydnum rufescens UP504]
MGRVEGKASARRRKTSMKKSPTHPFGRPATINDLPVETLLESSNTPVDLYFHEPIDVLHITRTNTFLRQLVSVKSSTPFSYSEKNAWYVIEPLWIDRPA